MINYYILIPFASASCERKRCGFLKCIETLSHHKSERLIALRRLAQNSVRCPALDHTRAFSHIWYGFETQIAVRFIATLLQTTTRHHHHINHTHTTMLCARNSFSIFRSAINTHSLSSVCELQVKVTVLDKNDSPPEFRDTPLHFTVSEDLGAGHAIATIRATDPDTIGTLTYTLRDAMPNDGGSDDDGAEAGAHFQLDAGSGVLTLRDTLDRETKDVYELVVRVSDGIQYTETTATVQVSRWCVSARTSGCGL